MLEEISDLTAALASARSVSEHWRELCAEATRKKLPIRLELSDEELGRIGQKKAIYRGATIALLMEIEHLRSNLRSIKRSIASLFSVRVKHAIIKDATANDYYWMVRQFDGEICA